MNDELLELIKKEIKKCDKPSSIKHMNELNNLKKSILQQLLLDYSSKINIPIEDLLNEPTDEKLFMDKYIYGEISLGKLKELLGIGVFGERYILKKYHNGENCDKCNYNINDCCRISGFDVSDINWCFIKDKME